MLSTDHHKLVTDNLNELLRLSPCQPIPEAMQTLQQMTVNMSAILFTYMPACFMALHLVYEVRRSSFIKLLLYLLVN